MYVYLCVYADLSTCIHASHAYIYTHTYKQMVCSGNVELLDPVKIVGMGGLKWDKRPKEAREDRQRP
jgi:hypothetical protein